MDVLSPATNDHSRTPPAFRPSFAVPTKSAGSPKLSSPSAGEAVEEAAETLYAHNAGKIVSFNPPISGTRRHSSVEQGYSALQDEPVGTLPWASATERTLAAGKHFLGITLLACHLPIITALRSFTHLSSPWFSRFSQFWQQVPETGPAEVAVLVCRWRIQICPTGRSAYLLPD